MLQGLPHSRNSHIVVKAQSDEVRFFPSFSLEDLFSNISSFLDTLLGSHIPFKVASGGSSNVKDTSTQSEASVVEEKDVKQSNEPSSTGLATEESISEFITQVASLVK